MLDHQSNMEIESGTEKGFGLVFCVVFLLISAIPLLGGEWPWLWAAVVAAIFGALALFAPHALRIPNLLWFRFSLVLGAIVSNLVMVLVYIIAIVPMGLLMRLFREDPLARKFDRSTETYWIKRSEPPTSMRNQF